MNRQDTYLFEAVDGGSSLSDDVFVVFGVHGDLDVLHVGLQVFRLLLKGVTDLVSFLRGAINLDQVTLIQERDVGLSKCTILVSSMSKLTEGHLRKDKIS